MIGEDPNGIPNNLMPYIITDRRIGDIGSCYADPTKAFKELGWETKKKLRICVKVHRDGKLIIQVVIVNEIKLSVNFILFIVRNLVLRAYEFINTN